MIKIYKLIYNNEVVYVGRTKHKLNRRIQLGYSTNVEKILKDCSIELIEETDDISRERYWIDLLKNEGHPLLNKIGGSTGLDHIEAKKVYRENNKESILEWQKEYQNGYYEKNKEDINRKRKEYRKKIKINNEY
jgi:hypothetical protein